MQAGQLRNRISIQAPVAARGPAGGLTKTWTDACADIPAAIEPLNGREQFAAAQIQSSIDIKITIRWRKGITAKMRVVHVIGPGSPEEVELFNIEAAIPDAPRRWLVLMCKQRAADGFQSDG